MVHSELRTKMTQGNADYMKDKAPLAVTPLSPKPKEPSWKLNLDHILYLMRWQLKEKLSPEAKAKINRFLDLFYRAIPQQLPLINQPAQPWPHNDGAPLVSVVIPCFNYGRFLGDALESVARQTLQDLEVIVVNDGSTDPYTCNLLENLQQPKVQVIHQANTGPEGARNKGISKARGKYICCLDADDILEPTYLEKCVSMLESNPGIGFAYSWLHLFGDEQGTWETQDFDIDKILQYNHVLASAVFKKEDWLDVGGYRPEMRGGYEDWEFWIRLGAKGLRGKTIPELLFGHRRHGKTLTHKADAIAEELRERIKKLNPNIFIQHRLRHKIRRAYHDIQPDRPFINLNHPNQYLPAAKEKGLLVLVPWLELGGADMVLRQILQTLANRWNIHVMTTVRSKNPLEAQIKSVTPCIYHLPNFLDERNWKPFVFNFLKTRSIHALLLDGSEIGYKYLPEIKKNRPALPIVNILHNDSQLGHFRNAIAYEPYIDRFVGVNQHIKESLLKNSIREEKIQVIFNGVDTEGLYNPERFDRNESRHRWGISREAFLVLFVGRLSEEKRPHIFVKIAENLLSENAVQFMMVGDGILRKQTEALLQGSPISSRLTWLPFVSPEEMGSIYAAADVLVLVSVVEGLPMVMLEALSMKIPVFATKAGEIERVIQPGINGYLAPVNRPMELLPALRQLIRERGNRFEELRTNARRSVVEGGYSLERVSKQYEALFENLASFKQLTIERH